MEKIIRDKIPDQIRAKGETIHMRYVRNHDEHIWFLVQKIQEERNEFTDAVGEEKIFEAGDVLEVYDSLLALGEGKFTQDRQDFLMLCEQEGLSIAHIISLQEDKREKKGSFEQGIILIV